jgi:hypothetical protein
MLFVVATLLVTTFAPVAAHAQSVSQDLPLPYGAEPNGSFPDGTQAIVAGAMFFSNGELIQVERATSCSITDGQALFMAVRYYDPNSGVAYADLPDTVVHCVRWWPEVGSAP